MYHLIFIVKIKIIMNVCIIGEGLTALSLAKNLTKKKINVQVYETKKAVNSSLNRTIGITKKNLEFLKKFSSFDLVL